jgi:hypothetical protein
MGYHTDFTADFYTSVLLLVNKTTSVFPRKQELPSESDRDKNNVCAIS